MEDTSILRGPLPEPDVAGGGTPKGEAATGLQDLKAMPPDLLQAGLLSHQEQSSLPPIAEVTSPTSPAESTGAEGAVGQRSSKVDFTDDDLEEMLCDSNRWTIFEDVEDEVSYLRRRGDILAQGLLAARAEMDRLHEAGLRLQDAHEALQVEVREVAGDAAYWRALAEARAEELAVAQANLASATKSAWIGQQQSQLAHGESAPGSPDAKMLQRSSSSPTRRKSLPGALWGISSTKSLPSLARGLEEQSDDAGSSCDDCTEDTAELALQIISSRGVDRGYADSAKASTLESEPIHQDGYGASAQAPPIMQCGDVGQEKQQALAPLDGKENASAGQENAPPVEENMQDLRAALRAAAAEAARVKSTRNKEKHPMTASESQAQQPLQPRQLQSTATPNTEVLQKSTSCTKSFHGPAEGTARCASPKQAAQPKSRSLGRPSRLSAACRARRESIVTKTPPRHRTPPPHLPTKSPGGACLTSPLAFASGVGGVGVGGVRRALFSPNSSAAGGKRFGPGSVPHRYKGLGSPSRRGRR
eukprot:TRINITY_DN47587_c0_g1_i1.p1 TRINITY_DN47587_c0_g1~~TRINITY_DN47587_c0_g1_i1.p1  ORF type:complete len:532 (-),score=103.41 TRINITY_DN47587_c0_g1_i1:178-1773(-)